MADKPQKNSRQRNHTLQQAARALASQVEKETGTPLKYTQAKRILESMNYEFTVEKESSASPPREAMLFQREQTALHPATPVAEAHSPAQLPPRKETPGKVIVLTSATELATVKMVSLLLGGSLKKDSSALESPKVLVVDGDLVNGTLGFLVGSNRPTIINGRLHWAPKKQEFSQAAVEKILSESLLTTPGLAVDLLLAPKRPRVHEDAPPEFMAFLLQNFKDYYDYIIVATGVSYLDKLISEVFYPLADNILYTTSCSIASVFSMTRWIQEVIKVKEYGGMGIPEHKIGLLVSDFMEHIAMPPEKLEKAALGLPLLGTLPSMPRMFTHAGNLQNLEALLEDEELGEIFSKMAAALR